MNEGKVVARVAYFTPPLRYLANDGGFPESVEPLNDTLNDLSTKDDYFEKVEFLKGLGSLIVKLNAKA